MPAVEPTITLVRVSRFGRLIWAGGRSSPVQAGPLLSHHDF